jgi:hypothetical protein
MNNAIIEPLSLFSTLGKDEGRAVPVVTVKNLISEQLADFSRSRFDGADVGGDPIALRVQVLYVHASTPNQASIPSNI